MNKRTGCSASFPDLIQGAAFWRTPGPRNKLSPEPKPHSLFPFGRGNLKVAHKLFSGPFSQGPTLPLFQHNISGPLMSSTHLVFLIYNTPDPFFLTLLRSSSSFPLLYPPILSFSPSHTLLLTQAFHPSSSFFQMPHSFLKQ